MSPESVRKGATLPDPQLGVAMAAFEACALAGMQPILTCHGHPDRGVAEFDVVLAGSGMVGLLHEQIEEALTIATDHGGSLWLDDDGKLCIVWPITPGPGELDEQPAKVQASQRRRRKAAP